MKHSSMTVGSFAAVLSQLAGFASLLAGAGQVIVCDGTPEADERLKRVLTNDPMMGIFRHVDAGYDVARNCADEQGVKIPMA